MVAFQKTTERFALASIMYSYFLDFTDDINPEVGTNIEMYVSDIRYPTLVVSI